MNCKLEQLFKLQEYYMKCLIESGKNCIPQQWPVDIKDKDNQLLLKSTAYDMMEEIFEATRELKNAKKHRDGKTSFNNENYKEELVDVLHYFIEILILSGINADDIYNSFIIKHKKNLERLN